LDKLRPTGQLRYETCAQFKAQVAMAAMSGDTRWVLAWRLSNTLTTDFCVAAL
jgi:hypothetical protein